MTTLFLEKKFATALLKHKASSSNQYICTSLPPSPSLPPSLPPSPNIAQETRVFQKALQPLLARQVGCVPFSSCCRSAGKEFRRRGRREGGEEEGGGEEGEEEGEEGEEVGKKGGACLHCALLPGSGL